jgi:MFS family permease
MDMDKAIEVVGGWGSYQKLLVLFYGCLVGGVGLAQNTYLYVGRALKPDCPIGASGCTPDNVCDFVSSFIRANASLTTYTVDFDLVCDRAYLLTFSLSAVFIGFGIGSFAGGLMAARHGRRLTCAWASLLSGLLSLAAAFSPGIGFLCAIHIAIGIASGISNCAGWTLVMEFVGSESRAFGGGIVWAVWTSWMMVGALIAFLTDSHTGAWPSGLEGWRVTKIAMSLPCLAFSLLAVWALPESPRFLAQRGDTAGARRILAHVARVNGHGELPREGGEVRDFKHGVDAPLLEGGDAGAGAGGGAGGVGADGNTAAAAGKADKAEGPAAAAATATAAATAAAAGRGPSTCELLASGPRVRGVPIRRAVLATGYLWFAATLSYYGLSIAISDMAGSVYVNNLLSSALEGPAYAFTGLFCSYFGRKGVMWATLLSSGVCCMVLAVAGDAASRPGWRALAFVAKFGATLAFSAVYIWTAELFPTDVRTVAFGLCNVVARSGGMLAPVILQLSSISTMVPSLVFGVIALSAALGCSLLPETVGLPLEDQTAWGETKHDQDAGTTH